MQKKDAAFSIRMTPEERGSLDTIATKYDRPRSWVVRKLVKRFGILEQRGEGKRISEKERAALEVMQEGMRQPLAPVREED